MFKLKYLLQNEVDDGAASDGGAPAPGDGGAAPTSAAPVAAPAQAATGNWRDTLPEDLRGNTDLEKFTTIEGLAKSYINASQMIGRDKFALPKTDDEWNDVYGKLGRPAEASAYQFGIPDNLPAGMNASDELAGEFKEVMFKLGLNENQAKGLNDWYWEKTTGKYTELTASLENDMAEAESELRGQWGERFDSRLAQARRAVVELGSEDLLTYLSATGLGNDTQLLQFFAGLGEKMMESTGLEGTGQSAGQTPDEIQAEIGELMKSSAYTDTKDPTHAATVKKMQKLYERLYAAA